jgi:site-specific recombinase XerD
MKKSPTENVADALTDYEQARRDEIANWSREHARESRVVRELCNWYRLKHGLMLSFDDMTCDLIRRYRAYRQQFDTPSAYNRRRTSLHTFCKWAVRQKLLHANPVSGVPVMKRRPQRIKNR